MTGADKIAEMIEHMLTRPSMYARTSEILEHSLLTAMSCWTYASGLPTSMNVRPTKLWRNAVAAECHVAGIKEFSVATLAALRPADRDQPQNEVQAMPRVVRVMRSVWCQLRSPIDQLGAVSEG